MLNSLVVLFAVGTVRQLESACAVQGRVFADAVDFDLIDAMEPVRPVPTAVFVGCLDGNGNSIIDIFLAGICVSSGLLCG